MQRTQLPIQFKGSLFTLTILQIQQNGMTKVDEYLAESIKKAPNFFINAPIIVDITDLTIDKETLDSILNILRSYDLIPIGAMTKDPQLQHHILAKGLAIFPSNKQTVPLAQEKTAPKKETKSSTENKAKNPTKLILAPVRSGQQIYAKDADLVILNSVSHGAEVIADGNIHVYGTLNGRALAGVNGNAQARIFCKKLNAELISIAGLYQLSEDFKHLNADENMQVFLADEQLHVESLS
ncbi:MAG: septum site-determining protein MinC [Legionellales bacterium]|nr:septum site-determining protein MinC [Legionellales bacterium]|tara:strand:- start:68 stop:784 length:717 start_codon:yes stop_codon:yes gene_type:complete